MALQKGITMQMSFAPPQISRPMKILLGFFLFVWILFQIIGEKFFHLPIIEWLGLIPGYVLQKGCIWQLFTYIFLHSLDVSHILLNLLMTWFLGSELERLWGWRRFLFYYLGSGVGAALFYTLTVFLWHTFLGGTLGLITPVIGASGSVFGLILAYGILFSDRTIYFMLLFPMKVKAFVLILAGVEILSLLAHGVGGSGVANLAHLGGFISGYLLLLWLKRNKKKLNTFEWQRKSKLRLVVDNEKEPDQKTRYWN